LIFSILRALSTISEFFIYHWEAIVKGAFPAADRKWRDKRCQFRVPKIYKIVLLNYFNNNIEIIGFNQKMLPKFVKCNGSNGLKEITPAGMQLV
jgi:hypothetical protein